MKLIFPALLIAVAVMVLAFTPKPQAASEKAPVVAGGEGLQFVASNWNTALAEAKKQNKLIFLDAYASWCGPCKLLKKNTFPDKVAGEYFNKNFINVAIDMEKADGPALAQKYGVNAYPTLIITDADGKMITYTQGYIDAKQLVDFGKYGVSQSKK